MPVALLPLPASLSSKVIEIWIFVAFANKRHEENGMARSLKASRDDISQATDDVFDPFKIKGRHISKNSYGRMVKGDRMDRDGSKMCKAEESSVVKWFGKQAVVILLSCAAVAIFLFVTIASWFQTFRQSFWMDGKYYSMVGLSKVQDGKRQLYLPIFEEKK